MAKTFGKRASKRNHLRQLALQVEKVYSAIHRFLAWATRRLGKPMAAEIYHATPIASGVSVKGRVLLAREWRDPQPEDPAWLNLFQMLKHWATPERPHSLVKVSLEGAPYEQRADKEGYFEFEIPQSECRGTELLIELPESEVSEPLRHKIDAVGEGFSYLVISDVDDTVLVTHAARRMRMIATTLFGNALTRQIYPGTAPSIAHFAKDRLAILLN